MLYATFLISVLIATASACFFLMAGAFVPMLLSFASVITLTLGILTLGSDVRAASKISIFGAGLGALAMLITIVELAHAIPFNTHPEQQSLLFAPLIALGIFAFHGYEAHCRMQEKENEKLMAGLSGDQFFPEE